MEYEGSHLVHCPNRISTLIPPYLATDTNSRTNRFVPEQMVSHGLELP